MNWTWPGIVTAVFLAQCCWTGYRRGLIKEVVSTFLVLLSLILVWVVNPYMNRFIRENTSVYESVRSSCEELVSSRTDSLQGIKGEDQTHILDNLPLPKFLIQELKKNNSAEVYQYLSVNSFTEYVSGYLAAAMVNGLSFVLSFLLITLLIRMATYALDLLARLPVLHGLNRLAGAVVGLTKGVVFLWIALLLATVFCSTRIGGWLLALVQKDPLLSLLYENNILVRIFMSFFYLIGDSVGFPIR